jgi:predicted ATPase
MRLEVADAVAAAELLDALEQAGPVVVQRQEREVLVLWPATEADDADEWDEQTFAELTFFLRAWSGRDPRRSLTVLEERPIEVPAYIFRRAS